MHQLDVDYLVVGAGAAGLAFTDALIDHTDPSVRVAVVDRRDGVGGHWRAAYPFVRLHQASQFYGVASTVLGGERQTEGPEAGLFERADRDTVLAHYERVVAHRMVGPGRVDLLLGAEHVGDGVVRAADGTSYAVRPGARVVDATYLSPRVPSESPAGFAVDDDARAVAVNLLPEAGHAPEVVVVGSGKTATDAVVWLLQQGTDPDAIVWVRPREPWMLDRAVVQPDPTVFLGMAASVMRSAAAASSLDDLFLRLEDAGTMIRIDRSLTPTMAKAPTLGAWELDLLRTVHRVVRLGHLRRVSRGRLHLDEGTVDVAPDALVVDCAADGLRRRPRTPIWSADAITLQPVRSGFPCFGAALVGYVEATRPGGPAGDPVSDAEKNRLAPPSSFGNSLADWAAMNALGSRAATAFGAEPDIAAWAATVALNPSRVPPGHPSSPALDAARADLAEHTGPGVARLEELAGLPPGAS
ncbi:NAD(P)-binding protein [Nocardioides litoris]|uniref:NAD(P)-binding protein n=1 Tax=Nocardioides litoris TaxID=1926648 RepID=UPI00111FC101|nr:NAD(P)-binding protein [Nocardioides litoris]